MKQDSIKNLKIKSTVFDVCSKGCILIGTGFLGGTIALGVTGKSNVECALISFALLTTGIQLITDASSIKRELGNDENQHKTSILGQRKYDAHNVPSTKPLLTEEEMQSQELDASTIETKQLVKHK